MSNNISDLQSPILVSLVEKALHKPVFLASGSSWNRFLFSDGKPAAMPENLSDGQPNISANTEMLQLMSASGELYNATLTALEQLELIDNQTPTSKISIINLKIAIAKANNTHGWNDKSLEELRLEMFREEVKRNASSFHDSNFRECYQSKHNTKLDSESVGHSINSILTNIKIKNLDTISYLHGSDLDKDIFESVIENALYRHILTIKR